MKLIHAIIDGKVLCGVTADVATVPPRLSKHVTCKRCLRILRK